MATSITPGITVKNAGSERALSQEEQPPGIQSWQVFWDFFFSTSYICMETGFVPGSKAARVYYPQINP